MKGFLLYAHLFSRHGISTQSLFSGRDFRCAAQALGGLARRAAPAHPLARQLRCGVSQLCVAVGGLSRAGRLQGDQRCRGGGGGPSGARRVCAAHPRQRHQVTDRPFDRGDGSDRGAGYSARPRWRQPALCSRSALMRYMDVMGPTAGTSYSIGPKAPPSSLTLLQAD